MTIDDDIRVEQDGFSTTIEISFEKNTEKPSRIFKAMGRLIDDLHQLDRDLASSISVQIEPVMLLEDIQPGSVRTNLRTFIRQFDDDALKNIDWKPLIGQYLVKAKHKVLQWLGDNTNISDAGTLEPLEKELLALAQDTNVLQLPSYSKIPRKNLLNDLRRISDSARELNQSDCASFESEDEKTTITSGLSLTSEQIEELLTVDKLSDHFDSVFPVKKPDYLGHSQWELIYDDHVIYAKLLDELWVEKFQKRNIDVRPGDSLRARMHVIVRKAKDGSTVSIRYEIEEIYQVIHVDESGQTQFLGDGK